LSNAQAAPLKDATFAFTVSSATASTFTTTGTGKLTTNPARTDLVLAQIQFQGFTTSAEIITDQATTSYYIKVPALAQWIKFDPASLGISIGVPTILDYNGLQNVTLIGAETINGTATWHIQGTKQVAQSASQGNATLLQTDDFWFRQTDYYPVKITFQDQANASTGGTATVTPTTPTPSLSPTPSGTIPGSLRTATTPTTTPSATATAPASPTATAQVTLTETFTFSAWDSGLTITLPATSSTTG
jgi:hypothetical protein